ncbi:MAG TPA: tRNA (adenosine(37)-N6)-threonylcarbamoyltransferase complex dimerization subunit type 1 TsaB [Ferruginibacter sp.]|nr:tRNA (adenosine(37)-N6)-threonylcarbamoyltransferase complex dimerization subunit type 1 TsaB [Ferruginibacter sp.]
MSIIINIDTATEAAHVSVARDGAVLQQAFNDNQMDHTGFLQVAVSDILQKAAISFAQVDAIAVTIGPGSYTGLRVGLASAKGLCYALNKPLITIGTLDVLAKSALISPEKTALLPKTLLCPMIDARRMEVFTAIFDRSLNPVLPPCALILDERSFQEQLKEHPIAFFGNGSPKWQNICSSTNATFLHININPLAMSELSTEKYNKNSFSDLAYTEPTYIKEFYLNTI